MEKVIQILEETYSEATIALKFQNPLELLVATILAAQCTDERVNQVTKDLFRKYRKAEDYANTNPSQLEEEIRPTGFYKQKAKSIIDCNKKIVAEFGGEVPQTLEELENLPGVGRKTANVLLGNAFGRPAIAVDTHVSRLSNRLGLVNSPDPLKIEAKLSQLIPQEKWVRFTHLLVFHGRRICQAKKPLCRKCPLKEWCEWEGKLQIHY